MYIICVMLFSFTALSRRVGALQMSIIIIIGQITDDRNLPITTHQEFFTGEPEGAATVQPVAHGLVVGQVHHGGDAHGHHPALAPRVLLHGSQERHSLTTVPHTVIKSPQLLLWSRGCIECDEHLYECSGGVLTVNRQQPYGCSEGCIDHNRPAPLLVSRGLQ